MKTYSVLCIEQKMEFEKFNCFFVDFLRYSWESKSFFDRGWKRVYTRHNAADLLCISVDWFLCDKRFSWTVFPNRLSYILENHFYFVNSLSRILCVNSSAKVFSPQCEGPSTHQFCTSLFCTFITYRKKEVSVAKFFSK